jgi:twinkle protein
MMTAPENLSARNAPITAVISASLASASPSKAIDSSASATTALGKHRPLTQAQIEILDQRGLDVELVTRMGWRCAERSGSGDAIEIPFYRDGKEVNTKTRTLSGEKRFFQVEGGDKCVYNLDCLKDIGDVALVITEGEMDCIAALQCGYMAVSVPDGAPKEALGDRETRKYEYLKDIPTSIRRIIIATDGDGPGQNLLHDLSIRLGRHRCLWVRYPEGTKDLNEILVKHGAKAVHDAITGAQYMRLDGLYVMSDLPPVSEQPGLPVGIPALEKHCRFQRGSLSVLVGVPSAGKSTIVNALTHNMAHNHNWGICFASFEQKPQTMHRYALRTLAAERPAHLLDRRELSTIDRWIDEKYSFIVPDHTSMETFDLVWLKDRMAAAVARHNAQMIVIDPWNEIDHTFNAHEMTMTQYVGNAIKQLKRFADTFMVHVMVVAHPAKMQRAQGKYPIPSLYDVADSAHFYNKADLGLVIHRNDDGSTLFRVAKSRDHRVYGEPGDVNLTFSKHNFQFS